MKTKQHRTKTHQHSNSICPAKARCEEKVKQKTQNKNLYSINNVSTFFWGGGWQILCIPLSGHFANLKTMNFENEKALQQRSF
jgi:hypothetical protein